MRRATTGRRARASAAVLAVLVLAACAGTHADERGATPTTATGPAGPEVAPDRAVGGPASKPSCTFSGLGTWVDVFDYVPAFSADGIPSVRPADVATMRDLGVGTLYLQVARDDPRSPGLLADEPLAGAFLTEAHRAGIAVVAWYLPTHHDHDLDVRRALALAEFRAGGEQFDGVALDIEDTTSVPDVRERNRRLLDLARRLDAGAGSRPVGAIVYPPVALDVLRPDLWPDFPWRALDAHVDAWFPMAYWTNRDAGSPYRDAYTYTAENVRRVRDHLGRPDARVHVIGGIGDEATTTDYEGFSRAVRDVEPVGYSIYDFDTVAPSARPLLRGPAGC